MGYFQSVGSSSFKSDSQGNRLFYKWGIFGKGYVLTGKQKEEEIMKFLVLHYKISFMSIIVVSASLGASFAILTGFPLFTWYLVKTNALTKELRTSSEKLTLGEGLDNSVRNTSRGFLWLVLVLSLLLMLRIMYVVNNADGNIEIRDALGVFFFGGCAIVFFFMLLSKRD